MGICLGRLAIEPRRRRSQEPNPAAGMSAFYKPFQNLGDMSGYQEIFPSPSCKNLLA